METLKAIRAWSEVFQALNENNFNPSKLSFKIDGAIKGWAVPNHRRRKDKESESNINSAAHNQTLKQQNQINDGNHHIPININTECQWTQLHHQKKPFGKLD
jgi:hypothetical protein